MSEKKSTIGIPGYKLGENSFGCGINHLDFISQFGNPKILFPQDKDEKLDLLYLPGGADTNPSTYGQIPGFYTSNQDVFKQYFFDNNLKSYIESGIRVVGVCLGFQMLNVYFNGTITQNLRYHAQSEDRWKPAHEVKFFEDSKKKFKVNSHHHQGITLKDLSSELTPLLYADNEEDKNNPIIEAFQHKELPIIAFQYHCEEWRDSYSMRKISELLLYSTKNILS